MVRHILWNIKRALLRKKNWYLQRKTAAEWSSDSKISLLIIIVFQGSLNLL